MEEFQGANRTTDLEWKMEKKDSDSVSASLNARQITWNNSQTTIPVALRSGGVPLSPPPTPPAAAREPARTKSDITYRAIDYSKYSKYTAHKSSYSWGGNSELSRKRRVVKYNSYAAESQMKASLRNGFRWVKNKYCQIVYGY